MSLATLFLSVLGASAFDLQLKAVISPYRFTLWNSEPLSLSNNGGLTEVFPEPIQNVRSRQIQYIANFSVGSPTQELSFILTTSNPWLIISTPDCKDCFSERDFNNSRSKTFRGSKRRIVLDEFEASLGEDNITMPGDQKLVVGNQKVILVHKSPYLNNIQAEGVLVSSTQGLSYNKLLWDDMNLLENMKRHRLISRMVFSVHLYSGDLSNGTVAMTDSVISFGTWNLAQYARGEFSYMRLASEPGQWKVLLTSARFGKIELVDGYSTATIELGTSLLIVPNDVYLQIQYDICWKHTCIFEENLISFKCEEIPTNLPDLRLMMDQTEVVIAPTMYMNVEYGKCQMLMVPYDSNTWIIGTMILKRYYAVFDMEEHRIGLAPSVNLPVSGPWWLLWTFVILLVLAGAVAGGCYLYNSQPKKKKHHHDEEDETSDQYRPMEDHADS